MARKESKDLEKHIGRIVTLKSNHLKSAQQFENILLAGEPNYITPLMIVKEVLLINSDKIEEDSGEIKNTKGEYQFKCIWFSNKSFKIEEAWFYEKEVDEIKLPKTGKFSLKFGDNLVLKTNRLELEKKKTYLEIDTEKSNNKVSALLNFSSPVFIFLGYASIDKKEPLIDPNTGSVKRVYCSKLTKLKSFNVKEDKYSEFLIPIEAIEKISIPDINAIDDISQTVISNKKGDSNSYYVLDDDDNDDNDDNYGIYNPVSIVSVSNFYTVECENIFNQQKFKISLNEKKLKKIEFPTAVDFYPDIHPAGDKFVIESILEHLQKAESKNLRVQFRNIYHDHKKLGKSLSSLHIYRIGYKNKHEKYTNRFAIPLKLVDINTEKKSEKVNDGESESKKDKDKKNIEYYLYSFCLLRNDYRFFKIERMQYLEVHPTQELLKNALQMWFTSQAKYKL